MNKRVSEITLDIIDSVRDVLKRHEVTFPEYRAGFMHMVKTMKAGEVPLLIDLFFNTTICEIEDSKRKGSVTSLEGPYFLEDAPVVTDSLKSIEGEEGQPLLVQGSVVDLNGKPVGEAMVDIWHSTISGRYSGVHDNIPKEYYRGKLFTDSDGRYSVRTIMPAPYTIPDQGPTGELMKLIGRHTWRPAHVHFKIRKDGFIPHTSQAYFEGGDYVDSDCCEGVRSDLVMPQKVVDGVRVIDVDFVLDPAA